MAQPTRKRQRPTTLPFDAFEELLKQASQAIERGQLDEAETRLEEAQLLTADHPECLNLMGVLRLSQKRQADAVTYLQRALIKLPTNAGYHSNLGLIYQGQGAWQESVICFEKALELNPELAQAQYNLALALIKLDRTDEAIEHLDQVLLRQPSWLEATAQLTAALFRRGVEHHAHHRHLLAVADLQRVVQLAPDYAIAHYNLGNVLTSLEEFPTALRHYEQAIALHPQLAKAHAGKGLALQNLDLLEEALTSLNTALHLAPKDVDTLSIRGTLLKEMGKQDAALQDFNQAIQLAPQNPEPYWNKALAQLLHGNYREGWALYEWRWQHLALKFPQRGFAQPLWLGQTSLQGKTILLHAEQGLGDTLQFCRFVPMVKSMGARVVLEVQGPLLSLMRTLEGVDSLVAYGNELPSFDYHCPLMSLPLALGVDEHHIPTQVPYLRSQPEKRMHWEKRIGPRTKARVGLVWSGNARHGNDRRRSVPLSNLLSMLSADAHYVSLQQEVRESDLITMAHHPEIQHFGHELEDFSDTAALCDLMDLVVSVDTSVAHLSGALGKPTWIILPRNPDWRWMSGRTDSIWYPTAKLIRPE